MSENSRAPSDPQPGRLAGARLLLFLNLPLHEIDGEYSARYPHLLDFFLALGSVTSETALMVPLKRGGPRNPDYGAVAVPPGVRIVGLPHWSSARMMVRRFPWVVAGSVRVTVENLRRVDLVGAVAPSVVGTVLITLARLRHRPTFLLVRGEKQRTVRFIMGQRRARPYVLALRAMEVPVRHWIRAGVPTFVAGHELIERYAAPTARLHDFYPALSRDFPIASAPRRSDQGSGVLRLVTVARLSPEKGLDDLLRSVALLREQGTAVALDLVGDGPQRRELEALVDDLALGDRVHFAGFVPHGPELVSILDRNDVFVLSSRSEGLPHSLVEAMARALPVVATAIGGIPAFVGDGTGIVVPVGDPGALARALDALAHDPSRRASLSALALEKARRVQPDAQLAQLLSYLSDAYPALAAEIAGHAAVPAAIAGHTPIE